MTTVNDRRLTGRDLVEYTRRLDYFWSVVGLIELLFDWRYFNDNSKLGF